MVAGGVGVAGGSNRPVEFGALVKAWEVSQRSTREDWLEWMRRLSVELLRNSPSAALHACFSLALSYQPLARELFSPTFESCWMHMDEHYHDKFLSALETAFTAPTIPPEILQQLLSLVEYMEHNEQELQINYKSLGDVAYKSHAFAKALHYKEIEFQTSPNTIEDAIEALISINKQLEQPEGALGILETAKNLTAQGQTLSRTRGGGGGAGALNTMLLQMHGGELELKETWWEKLGRWDEALAVYDEKIEVPSSSSSSSSSSGPRELTTTGSARGGGGGGGGGEKASRSARRTYRERQDRAVNNRLGRMRCLDALGEWGVVDEEADELWRQLGYSIARQKAAAAAAGHGKGKGSKGTTSGSSVVYDDYDRFEGMDASWLRRKKAEIAPLAARAAWALSRWESMGE